MTSSWEGNCIHDCLESGHGQLVKPASGNYLSHVSKDRILSVISTERADLMRNLGKEQLVRKADEDEELADSRGLPENLKS